MQGKIRIAAHASRRTQVLIQKDSLFTRYTLVSIRGQKVWEVESSKIRMDTGGEKDYEDIDVL